MREAWEVLKLGWGYVAGIALGIVAVLQAVKGSHESAWFWAFCAMTALALGVATRLHVVARERDAASGPWETIAAPRRERTDSNGSPTRLS